MHHDVTVLLVDDEIGILEIFARKARQVVETVVVSERPQQAIELATRQMVDLAVLDYQMPEMNGLALFEELRKINPQMGCIFLTAHGEKKLVQSALRMQVLDFLDKPCDMEIFMATLERAIDQVKQERLKNASLSVMKARAKQRT
jgi:DNA-binding NtrC family response regulator